MDTPFHTQGVDGHGFELAAAAPSGRSSELLGFPPGARVLIVNNDDFGMYHAVNLAVIASTESTAGQGRRGWWC